MQESEKPNQNEIQIIDQFFEDLESSSQGIPADPDIFEAVFNFTESALTVNDLDDTDVVVDEDGFLSVDQHSTFSIE
jgi:hypothetical protein